MPGCLRNGNGVRNGEIFPAWISSWRSGRGILPGLLLGLLGCAHSVPSWSFQPDGRMNHEPIRESSGLVASRQYRNILWTHNDANNPPQIFAVRVDGKLIREYTLPGATNIDWEDIAWDEEGHLYVWDNASLRDAEGRNFLYIFPEPNPFRDETVSDVRKITVRYPDGIYDAEAIFIWDRTLYLVTKPWDGSLPRIYRYRELQRSGTAEFVGNVPVYAMITGGDISDDGRRVVLSSYVALLIFEKGATPEEMLQSDPLICRLNARQVEGISWDKERLVISNEQREIFQISESTWRDHNAPFLKTPKIDVPYSRTAPSVQQPLPQWPRGKWLRVRLNGRPVEKLARLVWSEEGLHVGMVLPPGLQLPVIRTPSPGGFDEWFRPGSIYLLVNPGGNRPLAYGKDDRCILLGRNARSEVVAQARYLRPATFIESAETEPGWVRVEHEGGQILVTLRRNAPGMQHLWDDQKIGFNLILISGDGQITSWAPLTLRYSWDSPSIWGLLELEK